MAVDIATAILAGLGVATDLMFIKLVKPLGALQCEFVDMRIFVIADDVRLGFQHGDEDRLVRVAGGATERAIQMLEEQEHMEVSRGRGVKTIAMTSSRKMNKAVRVKIGKRGVGMRREAGI